MLLLGKVVVELINQFNSFKIQEKKKTIQFKKQKKNKKEVGGESGFGVGFPGRDRIRERKKRTQGIFDFQGSLLKSLP